MSRKPSREPVGRMDGYAIKAVLLSAMSVAGGFAHAGTLVSFRPTASVADGLVTLGDVADVRDVDPAAAQRLATVILGPAPEAGRETAMAFERVRARLMTAGMDLAGIEFSGPTSVIVRGSDAAPEPRRPQRRAAVDARDRVQALIEGAVRKYLATSDVKGTFSVVATLSDDEVRVLSEAASVEVSGGEPPWSGSQTFTLRMIDGARRPGELRLACEVTKRPNVLAARHALTKGQVIRPDDLVWKAAASDAEAAGATDARLLLGRETLQPIRSQQAIPPDAVRALPLVRSGQFVTVTSRRPGVAVQRVMKARGDGAAGQTIELVTLEDHKPIAARVTGLQEAEVVDVTASGPSLVSPPGSPEIALHTPGGEPATRVDEPRGPRPRVLVNPSRPLSVPNAD